MIIRKKLEYLVEQALQQACNEGKIDLEEVPEAALERPRDEGHGDWASTVALRCAKQAKRNPREVAQIIVDNIPENDCIESLEIAGPGFINIHLKSDVLQGVLKQVFEENMEYGRAEVTEGYRLVNLEYVSANPTGPMHIGHGRWAALGDATARIMRHAGYEVYEEFYINDAGVQMDLFGASVSCRYLQLLGQDIPLPENGYGGSYVADIANRIIERDGDRWLNLEEDERLKVFREMAYQEMLQLMKNTLGRFGTTFDSWFSERSLYEKAPDGSTAVSRALKAMDDKGYVFEREGATWFRSTAFGDEKDRVLIKENKENTYFMSDVAYHYDKLTRGFEHLINIWGADHHGYVKRCEAMMAAWDRPGDLEVILGQLVNLSRGGVAVRMSKRTGEMVTFEELINEVGVDATRYLMLSRSNDQAIDFDIEVAKKKDASNPVYYVQYAHARICSILRNGAGLSSEMESASDSSSMNEVAKGLFSEMPDLSLLSEESELALMRKMAEFPEFIVLAARDRAPFRLTHFAQDLAALFHQFYTSCHVLVDDEQLKAARLYLVNATRIVLALNLNLLGISQPTKM